MICVLKYTYKTKKNYSTLDYSFNSFERFETDADGVLRHTVYKKKYRWFLVLACIAFDRKYSESEILERWNDFIKRHSRNQFKRNCLPDGPKVGTVSISPRGDKRMPADVDLSNWQV